MSDRLTATSVVSCYPFCFNNRRSQFCPASWVWWTFGHFKMKFMNFLDVLHGTFEGERISSCVEWIEHIKDEIEQQNKVSSQNLEPKSYKNKVFDSAFSCSVIYLFVNAKHKIWRITIMNWFCQYIELNIECTDTDSIKMRFNLQKHFNK